MVVIVAGVLIGPAAAAVVVVVVGGGGGCGCGGGGGFRVVSTLTAPDSASVGDY